MPTVGDAKTKSREPGVVAFMLLGEITNAFCDQAFRPDDATRKSSIGGYHKCGADSKRQAAHVRRVCQNIVFRSVDGTAKCAHNTLTKGMQRLT